MSVPAAYTTCQPILVPCDYPDNIFDAISKIFQPQTRPRRLLCLLVARGLMER